VRYVSERAATQKVAAKRFVVIFLEQIRNIGTDGDVTTQPIAPVEIDDSVCRNRTGIHPRQPRKPMHPAVPQRAADPTPFVRRPDAELVARSVWQKRVVRGVAYARM